jgi:hypothetical protein
MNFWLPVSGNFVSIFNYGLLFLCFFMFSSRNEKLHKRVIFMADGTGKTTRRLFYGGNVGSVAKIIFPQFDTTIITFLYHFPGNVDDKLFQL